MFSLLQQVQMNSSDYSISDRSDYMVSLQQKDVYLHKNIMPVDIKKDAIFGDPSYQLQQPKDVIFLKSHQNSQNQQDGSHMNESEVMMNKSQQKQKKQIKRQAKKQEVKRDKKQEMKNQRGQNMKQEKMQVQIQENEIEIQSQSKIRLGEQIIEQIMQDQYINIIQEDNKKYKEIINHQLLQCNQDDLYEVSQQNKKCLKVEMNAELKEVLQVIQDRMTAINGYLQQVIKNKGEELKVLHQFKQQTSRKLQENLRILMKEKMSQINRQNIRELKDVKNLCINTIDRMSKIQTNIAAFTLQVQKIKEDIYSKLIKHQNNLSQTNQHFIKINEDNFNMHASILKLEKMIEPIKLMPPKLDILEKKLDRLQSIQKSMIKLEKSVMLKHSEKEQQPRFNVTEKKSESTDLMNKIVAIENKMENLSKLDGIMSMLKELGLNNSHRQ